MKSAFFPACFILLTIVLLPGLVACKKQKIERRYTGDFLFTVVQHSWQLSSGTFDTTYTHEGSIELTDAPTDVSGIDPKDVYIRINFSYSGIYGRTAVTRKGEFTSPGCEGEFVNNDELNCVLSHTALSSSYQYTIHGVRR